MLGAALQIGGIVARLSGWISSRICSSRWKTAVVLLLEIKREIERQGLAIVDQIQIHQITQKKKKKKKIQQITRRNKSVIVN